MQKPIPTQLSIVPRSKTWKNWKLVNGEDGFQTREAMEKYLCNPERVRELEECRVLNLETNERLNALLEKTQCQGCSVPHGGLYQISEPSQATAQGLDAQDMSVWLLARRSYLGSHREAAEVCFGKLGAENWDNYTKLAEFFAAQATKGRQ